MSSTYAYAQYSLVLCQSYSVKFYNLSGLSWSELEFHNHIQGCEVHRVVKFYVSNLFILSAYVPFKILAFYCYFQWPKPSQPKYLSCRYFALLPYMFFSV